MNKPVFLQRKSQRLDLRQYLTFRKFYRSNTVKLEDPKSYHQLSDRTNSCAVKDKYVNWIILIP
jgi:hypothetical protein